MRSDELAEKLGKMFSQFGQGHDKKIKHKDLDKVIAKLTGLRDELTTAAESTKAAKKAERMAVRRDKVALLTERAEWLSAQLPRPAPQPADPSAEADAPDTSTGQSAEKLD